MKSECCKAKVRAEGGVSRYYICLECNKPCDVKFKSFVEACLNMDVRTLDKIVEKINEDQRKIMDLTINNNKL